MEERGPFKTTSTREVYRNRWLTVREDQVIRPDGKAGIFGVVRMMAGSSVIAIDSEMYVYLTREFKYGINRDSFESMSGAIEGGETPLQAAQRELQEETGLVAKVWIDMGVVDPFTTVIESPNHMFLAMELSQGNANLDAGETLDVIRIPFEEAVNCVISSKITHGASCTLILKSERYLRANGLLTSDIPPIENR